MNGLKLFRLFRLFSLVCLETAPSMEDKRKWYRLTLPGTTAWNAFSHPMTAGGDLALDPLRVWPDAWTPSVQNPAWERAMTWDHLDGFHAGMLSDVGIKQYAVNYAFNDLYEYIPSGCNDFNMLRFDVRPSSKNAVIDHLTKQKNFYGALQYLQQYPERDRFQSVLGYSPKYHDRLIQPTIYSTAQKVRARARARKHTCSPLSLFRAGELC